jgi:hypothetical protein
VDITAHALTKDGNLREVAARSGGRWGSVCIDENFVRLLDQVFGKDVMDYYRTTYPQEWEEALLNFEMVKMTTELDKDDTNAKPRKIRMSQFISSCVAICKKEPSVLCTQSGVEGIDFLSRGLLALSTKQILKLFEPIVRSIVDHVKGVLLNIPNCQYIFLVGGFAESPVLKSAFDQAFGGGKMEILRPPKASLAVLTGGVMYGLNPSVISKRISPFGYGIDSHGPFDPSKHDPTKKVVLKDGRVRCEKLLSYHVKVGQEMGREETFQRCYGPLYNNQETVDLRIIQTSDLNALYSDEDSCRCVGILSLHIDAPTGKLTAGKTETKEKEKAEKSESKTKLSNILRGKNKDLEKNNGCASDRDIIVQIRAGGTSVKVTAIDSGTGQKVEGEFEPLYDKK